MRYVNMLNNVLIICYGINRIVDGIIILKLI